MRHLQLLDFAFEQPRFAGLDSLQCLRSCAVAILQRRNTWCEAFDGHCRRPVPPAPQVMAAEAQAEGG